MPITIGSGDSSGGGGSQSTGIYVVDVSNTSNDLAFFIDLVDNPSFYKGVVVYVKTLEQVSGREPWPDPFLFPNKFYFNEDGEWFESPFSLNGIILE
jgi:hypothetical protein